jgi:hypothetical protein
MTEPEPSMAGARSHPGSASAGTTTGLTDSDTGRYELHTHTARYLLDLDTRRLQRIPRSSVAASVDSPAPVGTVVFLFDVDGDWLELAGLEHCAVGDEMRLRAVIDGQTQPWRTTAVLRIDRVPTPSAVADASTCPRPSRH